MIGVASMAVLHEGSMRERGVGRAQAEGLSVEETLRRVARKQERRYDIFLSQTIRDAAIVLGVYDLLTGMGYLVFCDWVEAPDVDRAKVTPANAAFIRARNVCQCCTAVSRHGRRPIATGSHCSKRRLRQTLIDGVKTHRTSCVPESLWNSIEHLERL
jgi:hypothetical protein